MNYTICFNNLKIEYTRTSLNEIVPLVTSVIRNGAISSSALASQTPERPPLVNYLHYNRVFFPRRLVTYSNIH